MLFHMESFAAHLSFAQYTNYQPKPKSIYNEDFRSKEHYVIVNSPPFHMKSSYLYVYIYI